jgi:site-specific DNA recombinase
MSGSPARRTRRRFKKLVSDKAPTVPFTPEGDGAICYVRQSHYTDESMSSETQTMVDHRWANAYGVPIVATVEDLHVSGDLDPFKRTGSVVVATESADVSIEGDGTGIQVRKTEGLAVWLTDAPPRPWKTLIVSKLDRLVRNPLDALNLLNWVRARGKRLVCIAEGVDSANSMGEFLITLIASFARMERDRMIERFKASKAALKEAGRWGGEGHMYGTMPVELPGGGWVLGLDQYAVKILHKLGDQARHGKGLTEMIRWLSESHVVTPRNRQLQLSAERRGEDSASVELRNYEWDVTVLGRLLRNPDLVEFGIFEPAEQAEIIARLDEKSRRNERGSNQPYNFSGILVCPDCWEPLWHRAATTKRTAADGTKQSYNYSYWHCATVKSGPEKHGTSMRAEEVEPMAEEAFYAAFSMVPVRERVVLPPTNHANEIAKLEREHAKLMVGIAKANTAQDRQRIISDGEEILRDLDTLRSLPVDPGGVQWVPTDRTWREELEGLTPEDRRLRWLELGYQFAVQKRRDGSWVAGIRLPDGWRESMPELAEWHDRAVEAGESVSNTVLIEVGPDLLS